MYGYPSDDRLLTRCITGDGTAVALYVNTGGGAAVGVSYSVTTERKPELPERQVMYSDYPPEFTALSCTADGFELTTSVGPMRFSTAETEAMRIAPRNLGEEYRRRNEAAGH